MGCPGLALMSWVTNSSGVYAGRTFHSHCSLSRGQAAGFGAQGLFANQISFLKLEATKQNVHMKQVCRNVSQTPSGSAGGSRMGTNTFVRVLANTYFTCFQLQVIIDFFLIFFLNRICTDTQETHKKDKTLDANKNDYRSLGSQPT